MYQKKNTTIHWNNLLHLSREERLAAMERWGRGEAIASGAAEKARQFRSDMRNAQKRKKAPLYEIMNASLSNITEEDGCFSFQCDRCLHSSILDNQTKDKDFCTFCIGYCSEIFEELTNASVDVEIKKSIVWGDAHCHIHMSPVNETRRWLGNLLNEIEEEAPGKKVLENCGRLCAKSHNLAGDSAGIRCQVEDKQDHELLFQLYREQVYHNSPRLYKEDNTIYLEYHACGCPLVKKGEVQNPFFCHCTRGYTKERFETLFGRPVKVKLLQSLLKGDPICKQAITLED